MQNVTLIGAASGWGAQIKGCEDGPQAILGYHILNKLQKKGLSANWQITRSSHLFKETILPTQDILPVIVEHNHRLAKATYQSIKNRSFPIIFGGDHSIAIGSWHGISKALREKNSKPIGMIWIDAHMDAHTPQTTPSNARHGMPVASLLGYGPKVFTHYERNSSVLSPKNLCLIGIRSYEEGEQSLLNRLGIKIFYMEDLEQTGLKQAFKNALAIATNGTCGFGISLDVDVFDPIHAPGVGSPASGGVNPLEMLDALKEICHHPSLQAFEVVEYNPHLDEKQKTLNLIFNCVDVFLDSWQFPGQKNR